MSRMLTALLAGALLGAVACSSADTPGPQPSPTTPARTSPAATTPGPTGPALSPTGAAPTGTAGPTAPSPTVGIDQLSLRLAEVATGLAEPVRVLQRPTDGRLVAVELPGRLRVLGTDDGAWLDITGRVAKGGERGLLSAAFHPDFPGDDRLFLHYSGQPDGRTVVSSMPVVDGRPDPGRETVLLEREQPAANHNGGMLRFGPDGMLYLALGDGGGAGDQFGNGQRPDTLLGTILRADVSAPGRLAPPPDNPFVEGGGHRLVWQYGLRNPFSFTFDDGRLFIADVGQDAVEEIDVTAAGRGGLNFGWPILEGSRCFESSDCDRSGLVAPVLEYTQAETGGCSIIGGEVYRGSAVPALDGHYFYGDLCSGLLRSAEVADGRVVERRDWTAQVGGVEGVLGFGRDADGEVYLTLSDGRILRITSA